jgi:phosphotransferase system enzyme I (PtsI)
VDPVAALVQVQAALACVADMFQTRAAHAPGQAGDVLRATALMARDPGLNAAVETLLESGLPAAHALDAAVEGLCEELSAAGGYVAERVADLRDVRDRALAVLLGMPMPGVPHPGHPFVLVGRDLSPVDTATLDPREVIAVVTELGGPTSHTAILTKGLGIPAVVGCAGAVDLADGVRVIVDGSTGRVVVDPDETARARAEARAQARAEARAALAASTHGPGRTADGHPVALLANIGGVQEALRAAEADTEGVGLFRTEALFLDRRDAPSEVEQAEAYTRVLAAFGRRRVVVRTLDAGADKPLAFLRQVPEGNPALGVRGYRVARRHPDLLDTQLAALARAGVATGADVRVMAPMITTAAEAAAFRGQAMVHGLATAGVMVEVPAAALRAPAVLAEVDFVSLGTNDLAQYAFAADRLQGDLADLLDPWQPALLDLIARVGAAGAELGKPVGACGEAAGDPLLACVLAGLGVSSLSMATGVMPQVRLVLAGHALATCIQMAEVARAATDAATARAAVRELADPRLLAAL